MSIKKIKWVGINWRITFGGCLKNTILAGYELLSYILYADARGVSAIFTRQATDYRSGANG
jgi:hypothetical protein